MHSGGRGKAVLVEGAKTSCKLRLNPLPSAFTRSEPPFRPQAAKTAGGGWWLSCALRWFVNRSRECQLRRYVGDDESHYLSCAWSYG